MTPILRDWLALAELAEKSDQNRPWSALFQISGEENVEYANALANFHARYGEDVREALADREPVAAPSQRTGTTVGGKKEALSVPAGCVDVPERATLDWKREVARHCANMEGTETLEQVIGIVHAAMLSARPSAGEPKAAGHWCSISYAHQPHDTCDGSPAGEREPVAAPSVSAGAVESARMLLDVYCVPTTTDCGVVALEIRRLSDSLKR
jgi:hypothetical protein